MPKAFLFWLIYIICLFLVLWLNWPAGPRSLGNSLPFFVLIGLLGWGTYGAPLKD